MSISFDYRDLQLSITTRMKGNKMNYIQPFAKTVTINEHLLKINEHLLPLFSTYIPLFLKITPRFLI